MEIVRAYCSVTIMVGTIKTRFRKEIVMICVKIFFNICHSKTKSDSNVCPNSSRGQSFNDRLNSISVTRLTVLWED